MSLRKITISNGSYLTMEDLPIGVVECEWVRGTNTEQLRVLKEQQEMAGLGGLDIVLLVPVSAASVDPFNEGFATKHDEVYYIGVTPPSQRNNIYGRFKDLRKTIRHEIGHIKNGDCDRNLPLIKWFYNFFWEEPMARSYARKMT